MLHATLNVFFPAACAGCNAAIATRARSRADVLKNLLRDARIRSLHSVRAVIEADVWRAPETGRAFRAASPISRAFVPPCIPHHSRMVGLPLSDQRLESAKPEP